MIATTADLERTRTMLDRHSRLAAIRAAFTASPAILLTYRGDSTPDLAICSGDTAEPGRVRVTYLSADGPRGHVTRRDLDGCIEHVADLCPATVRPATEAEVIAWTSTPAYLEGAERVETVRQWNEALARAAQEGTDR